MKNSHKKHSRYLKSSIFIIIGILIVLFVLMYLLRGIFVPLLIAFLIAYIFDPVVDFLESKGVRRGLAVGLLVIVILAAVLGIMSTLVPTAYREISDFYNKIPEYKKVIQEWLRRVGISYQLEITFENGLDYLQKNFAEVIEKATGPVFSFFKFVGGAISFIFKFIIFSLISIYLLYDIDNIKPKFIELIPQNWRHEVFDIFKEINSMLKHFLRGQLGVGLITGALYSTGLILSGIDFAIFIGFIAGILNFIPYFGPLFGIVPSVLFSLLSYHTFPGTLYHLLGVGLTFGVVQIIEGTFLTPMIIGEELKINPVIIILSVLIFGKLMGLLGILLAIPAISVIKVLYDRLIGYYKNTAFYKGEYDNSK